MRLTHIVILFFIVTIVRGQRLTHDFQNTSLSEALIWIDNAQDCYKLNFIFNELEDFTVTTQLKDTKVRDAVRQVCGFYPMHITYDKHDIYIECIQKSETKLTGHITNERDRPVVYASIMLFSPGDSTYLTCGVSNEAGDFVIPCSVSRVIARISCIGYKTIEETYHVGDVGNIRMMTDKYVLQDVTVQGSKVTHYPDKDVWTITDEMRLNTVDVYDILEKLPGLYIDKVDRKMLYKGKENVVVIVDGKEKDISYIGNLHNMRFRQIEVYEQSHPRYPNADVVINIITKERWSGFDFSDNANTRLLPSACYGSLFSTVSNGFYYTYTRPKYDFSTSFWYSHYNRKYDEDISYSLANQFYYQSVDDGQPDISRYSNSYEGWADFDYKLNENHSVSAKYSYAQNHFNQWGNTIYNKNGVLTDRTTRDKNGSRQHTATLFYRGKTETWTIYSDLGIDLYDDDVLYMQSESTGFLTSSKYHNTRKIASASLNLSKKINRNHAINLYLSGFYRHYKGEREDNSQRQSSKNSYFNTHVSYQYRIGKRFSGNVGVSFVNYHISAEGNHTNQTAFSGVGKARYQVGKKTDIMLNLSTSINTPGYQQTLPFVTRKDSMIYTLGNPSLKTETSNKLTTYINHGLFYVTGSFQYSGNKMSSVYLWDTDGIVQTSRNIRDAEWDIGCGFGPVTSKNKHFSGRASIYRAGGHLWLDDVSNTYSYWRVISDVSYNATTWGVQFQYSSQPRFQPVLQGISKGISDWWQLSAWKYFMDRRLMLRFSYQLPIRWAIGRNSYNSISTPFYEYSRVSNQYNDYRNSFYITIRYLIAKGHQVNKQDNNQINKGMVNEIGHQ